ncbi:SET domain-containing protein [Candidatus Kaiserbacteria bacterium]|nr:SET domain-containing protein [Candidatus Kaiserbacteria bacterium]
MLLVKTRIGPSTIDGTELFAAEFIPKGTRVWDYRPDFDLDLTQDQIDALPEIAKRFALRYAYHSKFTGKWILCADDGRFFNHSDKPNTTSIDSPDGLVNAEVASRDIQSGEELTTDYRSFDSDFERKMQMY